MSKDAMRQITDSINPIHEDGCMALRNRSWLRYEIGERVSDRTLHLRIVENSGEGTFCNEWICAKDIVKVLDIKSRFSGNDLNRLMGFSDLNTGGFVLAIFAHLGLVCKKDGQFYERVAHSSFRGAVEERLNN
jgi:hypothetical protein